MPARGYPLFDWSGDEFLVGVVATGVAAFTLLPLMGDLLCVQSFGRPAGGRRVVLAGLLAGVGLSVPVLLWWADPVHVVGYLDYTLLFLVGAAAWVGFVGRVALPCVGLSIRDDVSERGNPAAAVVVAAALLGAGLIYALANVGGGDTIWTTLLPAAAATGNWLGLWLLLAAATGVSDRVAIDRDPAAAARLAAYLLASAAILGASMAGDFAGYEQASGDLVWFGCWPTGAGWVLAIVAERRHQPAPSRPVGRVTTDALPTVVGQVVLAVAAIAWRVSRG